MKREKYNPPRQLPTKSAEHKLESVSMTRLRAILGEDDFEIRDERISDAGVDFSLEVTTKNAFHNKRAQVQMKATQVAKPNKDGSFSKAIPVATLNYLMNGGQSPMVMFYIKSIDVIYYAWVRDEVYSLSAKKPNWHSAKSVSIRFSSTLTHDNRSDIINRICSDADLTKRLFEAIGLANIARRIDLRVEQPQNDVSTSEDIVSQLLRDGYTMLERGQIRQVVELIESLPPDRLVDPEMHLLAAYAYVQYGSYSKAKGYIGHARLKEDWEKDSELLLSYLSGICDLQFGLLSIEQFAMQQHDLGLRSGSAFGLALKLEALRFRATASESYEDRMSVVRDVESLRDPICALGGQYPTIDSQFLALRAHAHGMAAQLHLGKLLLSRKVKLNCGLYVDAILADDQITAYLLWFESFIGVCLNDAVSKSDIQCESDVRLSRLQARFNFLLLSNGVYNLDIDLPSGWDEDLDRIKELSIILGDNERLVHAQMWAAEMYALYGRHEESRNLAQEALKSSVVLGLKVQEEAARRLLANDSIAQGLSRLLQSSADSSTDERFAAMFDSDPDALATALCDALGLPPERIPDILEALKQERSEID
jgi:hypothetical protein